SSGVANPVAVSWNVMPHQWFTGGASARAVLPTTWLHSCTVSRVSCQPATGRAGHLRSSLMNRSLQGAGSPNGHREAAGAPTLPRVVFSLVYSSTTDHDWTQEELVGLLTYSRDWNAAHGVTGLLLYRDCIFM